MKILLLEIIDPGAQSVETRYPPVGLAYLAGYGRAMRPDWRYRILRDYPGKQSDNSIVKTKFKYIENGDTIDKAYIDHFDIIGLTFVTQNAELAVEYVREIREVNPRVPIVAGGHHVSALPWWLEERTGANIVTIEGEGEWAFFEYCSAIWDEDYARIPGIPGIGFADARSKRFNMNDRGEPAKDLDSLYMPAIDLLSPGPEGIQMFTSRGCPYKCIFCSSSHFWGGVRYHSPERVVKEIKRIRDMGHLNVNIYDDLFAVNKKRLRKILKLMKRSGEIGRGQITCLGRANAMDLETAEILAEMGVTAVAFGLESGSDRVLKQIKGDSASVEHNFKAVRAVRKAGMSAVGSVVYGLPEETADEIMMTVDMVQRLPLAAGEGYLAIPFPGTGLWLYAQNEGLVGDDMDFSMLKYDWDPDNFVNLSDLNTMQLVTARELFREAFKR